MYCSGFIFKEKVPFFAINSHFITPWNHFNKFKWIFHQILSANLRMFYWNIKLLSLNLYVLSISFILRPINISKVRTFHHYPKYKILIMFFIFIHEFIIKCSLILRPDSKSFNKIFLKKRIIHIFITLINSLQNILLTRETVQK